MQTVFDSLMQILIILLLNNIGWYTITITIYFIISKMKPSAMRIPCVNQIYYQRMNHEAHRKKLLQIRETRKTNLCQDLSRDSKILNFKQQKANSFIKRFNQQSQKIMKNNMLLLNKLSNAKPSFHNHSDRYSQGKRVTYSCSMNPYNKKLTHEYEKQNERISGRIRTMTSSLKSENLDRQYQRTQQIKKRLMRFAQDVEKNKISLKSEKYLQQITDKRSKTKMSQRASVLNSTKISSKQPGTSFSSHTPDHKNFSHYKAQEIKKNKVDNPITHFKIRRKIKSKLNDQATTSQLLNQEVTNDASKIVIEKDSFFTTEPTKQ